MLITAAAGLAFVTLVLANVAVWFAGMHVSTDVSAFLDVGYDAEGVNLDLELKIKNPNAFMVEVLPFDLNVSFCHEETAQLNLGTCRECVPPTTVAPGQTRWLRIPISFNTTELGAEKFELIKMVLDSGSFSVQTRGEVTHRMLSLFEATIPVIGLQVYDLPLLVLNTTASQVRR
eukprot:TRINITY_DN8817_c0_g1_i2.p1 TRINITY_DN8817_c0_g1~~TRINITY_DN8817_c0_g1_i2.p1  ORF type:complete len:175 (+),score=36.27 TRINITY_DN8817_c0_g1_i2:8-532(+)